MHVSLERVDSTSPACVHSFRISFRCVGARQLLPFPKITQLRVRPVGSQNDMKFLSAIMVSGEPLDTFAIGYGDVISFLLNVRFAEIPDDMLGKLGRDSRWNLQLAAGDYDVVYRSCVTDDYNEHLVPRLEREAEIAKAALFIGALESNAIRFSHNG